MKRPEDLLNACRDYDHDTVAIISQVVSEVIESTNQNKQRAELKMF